MRPRGHCIRNYSLKVDSIFAQSNHNLMIIIIIILLINKNIFKNSILFLPRRDITAINSRVVVKFEVFYFQFSFVDIIDKRHSKKK